VPMTLGQEFRTYSVMLAEDQDRLHEAARLMCEINLGATAIGTGINTHPNYAPVVCRYLAQLTGIALKTSPDLVEATQDVGAFVQISGVLKRVAVKLSKVCTLERAAGRLRRDQPAADAGRLQHHAGQSEPGDSGGRQPDRVRGDRK
jgi:aspartate ammonia-lyase